MATALQRKTMAADFARKPFYKPGEVAEILSVSTQHVLDLIHLEKLAAVRISERIYRIPLGGLLLFLGEAPRINRIVRRDAAVDDAEERHLVAEHRPGR